MGEVEHHVSALLHEAVPEPPHRLSIDEITQPRRHRRITMVAAPVLTAAAVVALVLVAALLGNSHPAPRAARPAPEMVSTALSSGLTLKHPASWHYLRNGGTTFGSGTVLGYLVNQPVAGGCELADSAPPTVTGCPAVAERLRAGGVFALVVRHDETSTAPLVHPTQLIDGYPAAVTGTTAEAGHRTTACPLGATDAIDAEIAVDANRLATYSIRICLADPSRAARQEARAVVDTATITAR